LLQGQKQQTVTRREEEKMSGNLAHQEKDEQLKIETVIKSIQVEEYLDKDQLHEAFISAGLDEVTDTVRHTYMADSKPYHMFQLIDQIFSQLDEENNGYITSETLLAVIKSIQDAPSSPLQDGASGSSPNPPWGVFSNSPTSLPCVSYFTDYSHGSGQGGESLKQSVDVSLFSNIDPQDTGYAVWQSIQTICRLYFITGFPLLPTFSPTGRVLVYSLACKFSQSLISLINQSALICQN
jgi:hypothetical protein